MRGWADICKMSAQPSFAAPCLCITQLGPTNHRGREHIESHGISAINADEGELCTWGHRMTGTTPRDVSAENRPSTTCTKAACAPGQGSGSGVQDTGFG